MNRKGQALIEFILILPIFLMILFVIVDFGFIFTSKNNLENYSSDIVEMIRNGEDINKISSMYNDINIEIEKDDSNNYYTINLTKEVNLVTPGINRVLDDPYIITIKRVVYYDDTK